MGVLLFLIMFFEKVGNFSPDLSWYVVFSPLFIQWVLSILFYVFTSLKK